MSGEIELFSNAIHRPNTYSNAAPVFPPAWGKREPLAMTMTARAIREFDLKPVDTELVVHKSFWGGLSRKRKGKQSDVPLEALPVLAAPFSDVPPGLAPLVFGSGFELGGRDKSVVKIVDIGAKTTAEKVVVAASIVGNLQGGYDPVGVRIIGLYERCELGINADGCHLTPVVSNASEKTRGKRLTMDELAVRDRERSRLSACGIRFYSFRKPRKTMAVIGPADRDPTRSETAAIYSTHLECFFGCEIWTVGLLGDGLKVLDFLANHSSLQTEHSGSLFEHVRLRRTIRVSTNTKQSLWTLRRRSIGKLGLGDLGDGFNLKFVVEFGVGLFEGVNCQVVHSSLISGYMSNFELQVGN
ncbi:hypothetical protein C8F04DRAFT_1183797 [Mycena alexandri]|uniref:Uncharacterized protein n=1 Tax=Mycena alexandri TaxID=1745969 RepID=A0AAD6SW76_9AGAR|nr:hypothetical protein C8F04DRAFT_1183797 [Mycena alexandri]